MLAITYKNRATPLARMAPGPAARANVSWRMLLQVLCQRPPKNQPAGLMRARGLAPVYFRSMESIVQHNPSTSRSRKTASGLPTTKETAAAIRLKCATAKTKVFTAISSLIRVVFTPLMFLPDLWLFVLLRRGWQTPCQDKAASF